jgi:G3E family GTPase
VKLESQFIKSKNGDVIELTNGCMCCVAQYDFKHVINWILTEKPETEYILIEASGLSDPMPVAQVLTEGELQQKVTLDTIVCVVDTVNFFQTKQKYQTIMIQVSNSDIIVFSKQQQSNPEEIKKISTFINTFLPRIQIIEDTKKSSVDLLFGQTFIHQYESDAPHSHEHVDSLFWKSESSLDFNKVNQFLRQLPSQVIRVKGVLSITEKNNPPHKFLLQYVGSRSEVEQSEWQPDEVQQTSVLLLGKDFDIEKIKADLENCKTSAT